MKYDPTMTIQQWIDRYATSQNPAGDHDPACRCELCLAWWVAAGPEETEQGWEFGPFNALEFMAAGGVIPLHRGDDDSPGR